uniref:Uncharacterized protein n=1 Tax=Leviviridae sp. TaxID=2027243 RepID=A0A514D2L4_9VIRU|nr:MAG: hypothetical protein H2RhizoLitter49830_000003 [Leviviridae sp.]
MLEPGRVNDLPKREMNEVKDHDHEKDGFIADLQADLDLCSVTSRRRFRTVDGKRLVRPFRARLVDRPLTIPTTTTRHQESW